MTEQFHSAPTAQPDDIAMARRWFDAQSARFTAAKDVVIGSNGDIDGLRERREALEANELSVNDMAIDALKQASHITRQSGRTGENDISRQQLKHMATTILHRRAQNATVQADRREQEYKDRT